MHNKRYFIMSKEERDFEKDVPLFWNNEDGWVNFDSATEFSEQEQKEFHLPLNSKWVYYYDKTYSA